MRFQKNKDESKRLSLNRMIQNSFIDMESMFKLFTEDEEVSGGFSLKFIFREAFK